MAKALANAKALAWSESDRNAIAALEAQLTAHAQASLDACFTAALGPDWASRYGELFLRLLARERGKQ